MTTMTQEQRAATQSVRAKARKALNVPGADLPAAITKQLQAVVKWADEALKPTPSQKAKPGKGKSKSAKETSTKRAPVKKAA